MPDIYTLSRQLRDAVERQDAAELERLTKAYQAMVDDLEGDIDALSLEMAGGEFTAKTLAELDSYKRLIRRADEALQEYAEYLLEELALTAGLFVTLGVTNSNILLQQAAADAGVEAGDITSIDDEVIAALNRYLDEGSPLYARLLQYGKTNADRIKQVILESVALGLNPRELARRIVELGFGFGLTDALRMARTLQLYAYREATLANYQENSDIVKGWVWSSALIPGRTCMSCVNMHGTIHELDEILNDHHNGLCTMLPYLGDDNPIAQAGEAWFEKQSKAVQIQMMGKTKWDAWQAGKVRISDMTGTHVDPVYGEMRFERSLKDLLEN